MSTVGEKVVSTVNPAATEEELKTFGDALSTLSQWIYSDKFKKRNCFTHTVFVMFNRLFNILCTGDSNVGGDVRSALNHYEAERQRKGGG